MAADTDVVPAADAAEQTADPLDGFKQVPELCEKIDELNKYVADPSVFFQPQSPLIDAVRDAAKVLFKHTATAAVQSSSFSLPLQELYVDGFDAEQIWLQLELQTEPVLKRARRLLKSAGTAPTIVTKDVEKQVDALIKGQDQSSEDLDEDESDRDSDDDGDADKDGGGSDEDELDEDEDELDDVSHRKKRRRGLREDGGEELGESDDDVDEDELGDEEEDDEELKPKKKKATKGAGLSAVEDQFLSLGDMEKFLEASEKAAAGQLDDEAGLSGSDDEDEDEDEGMLDDDEDGEGQEGARLRSKRRKTSMFDEDIEDDEEGEGDLDMDDDADEDQEGDEDDEEGQPKKRAKSLFGKDAEDDDDAEPLSKHERHLKKVESQVRQLEEKALAEKPWQLKGEVSAADRPLNSALEVYMDIDTRAAPPPAPTEEQGLALEDMIKKRIVEKKFDDPIRILPPEPPKKRKEVELDDKKSSKGLAELYEEDYVQAVSGVSAPDKDDPIREEAKALFKLLCGKLDALSHFHYAPKPVVEELVVRSDVAALAMEEVAPLVVSTEAMQAPVEAHKPEANGAPQAEGELTREDRKRRRAAKKRSSKARKAQKEAERKAKGLAPLSQGTVVAGVAPVKKVESGGKQKKSEFRSSAVFARIQDLQHGGRGAAAAAAGKKPSSDGKSSASFKL